MAFLLSLLFSAAIGISLGLLGGGGSILALPVLVYVAGVDAREAVGMSLAIVGVTSLIGGGLHAKAGNVNVRAALGFSAAGLPGAFLGARFTGFASPRVLLLLFAGVMLAAGLGMLRSKREAADHPMEATGGSPAVVLAAGFGVGAMTGFLGVGGGFLIVPALVVFAKLPMKKVIGTSLLVIAANSLAGFAAHLNLTNFNWRWTIAFTLAAAGGSLIGERIAERIDANRLKQAFAAFIIGVALFLLFKNL